MMHKNLFCNTHHYYIGVRHAESIANVQRIIITHPETGCNGYGLTQKGVQQAIDASKFITDRIIPQINNSNAHNYNFTVNDINIYHSDFKRTTETAINIAKALNINISQKVFPSKLLRERYYGDLENKPYQAILDSKIFDKDFEDVYHNDYGIEPIYSISTKFKQFISNIENDEKLKYSQPKLIIVCSHGDNMRIYQSLFQNVPLNQCHKLKWYGNARVRDWSAMTINKQFKSNVIVSKL
eukprot:53502_1